MRQSAFTRCFNSFKSEKFKLHFRNVTDQLSEPESQILTSLSNHDHHPVPHINIVTKNTKYRVKITIFIMIVFRIGRSDNSSSSRRSEQRDQVWELGRRASLHTASRGGIPNTKYQTHSIQRIWATNFHALVCECYYHSLRKSHVEWKTVKEFWGSIHPWAEDPTKPSWTFCLAQKHISEQHFCCRWTGRSRKGATWRWGCSTP